MSRPDSADARAQAREIVARALGAIDEMRVGMDQPATPPITPAQPSLAALTPLAPPPPVIGRVKPPVIGRVKLLARSATPQAHTSNSPRLTGTANSSQPATPTIRTTTSRTSTARSRLRPPHPLDHIPCFRAVISAAAPVADLARELGENGRDLVGTLTLACGDLVHGFALPEGSRARADAQRRAWTAIRHLDRAVTAARINRLAPARVLKRAQRAIDRADVMLSTLPGVLLG